MYVWVCMHVQMYTHKRIYIYTRFSGFLRSRFSVSVSHSYSLSLARSYMRATTFFYVMPLAFLMRVCALQRTAQIFARFGKKKVSICFVYISVSFWWRRRRRKFFASPK